MIFFILKLIPELLLVHPFAGSSNLTKWRLCGKKLLNMKRKVFTSLIPGDGILSFNEIRVGLGRFIIISLKLKGNRNHLKQWKLLAAQIKRIGTQRGLKSPTNFVKLWDVFEGQYFYLCPVSILVFFTNKIFIKN